MNNIKIKYPKNQTPKETYYDVNHIACFAITQDITGECYLWKIKENGTLIKLKQGNTPTKLDEYATEQIKKGLNKIK
mgnify:FL=1